MEYDSRFNDTQKVKKKKKKKKNALFFSLLENIQPYSMVHMTYYCHLLYKNTCSNALYMHTFYHFPFPVTIMDTIINDIRTKSIDLHNNMTFSSFYSIRRSY
jgi:hypothetical protein